MRNNLERIFDGLYRRSKRATTYHMPYLRSLAEQCGVAVEFGTRGGGSTAALSFAGRLYSYDIQIRTQDKALWAKLEAACEGSWMFTIASSLEVEIPECDLLMSDSLHTYDQLHSELTLHCDRVRRWIVMHDTESYAEHGQVAYVSGGPINTAMDESSKGLRHAIADFLAAHPEWKQIRHDPKSAGLTTLERV